MTEKTQSDAAFRDWTGAEVGTAPSTVVPSVSAVVFRSDQMVLLQHRIDIGWWGIPGGSIEAGESVTQALIREVQEETGLIVEPLRLVGVYSDPKFYALARYPGGDVVHHINLCFECRARGGWLRGSNEGTQVGYHPLGSLPKPLLLSHKLRLDDAVRHEVRPVIR